jgi:hypothetical protein
MIEIDLRAVEFQAGEGDEEGTFPETLPEEARTPAKAHFGDAQKRCALHIIYAQVMDLQGSKPH